MYRYDAYGLTVEAGLPLPELPASLRSPKAAPDISVYREPLGTPPEPRSTTCSVANKAEQVVIAWGDFLTLRVRRGSECAFDASEALAEDMLRRYLLGPAMGLLLHQRGLLTLHASAVEIGGEAVIFVGQKGVGKSTTVAALLMRGHSLLADDIVAIDMADPSRPIVLPAFSRVRLLPDSAGAIGAPAAELEARAPSQTKRAWRVHDRFASAPVPLGHVFVLEEGGGPKVRTLTGATAVAPLIEHLYAPRFAGAAAMTPAHLEACATLARSTPITRITRGSSLQTLPQFVNLIEQTALATASMQVSESA